ncbi:MAG: SPASM domain-containing protein [Candidatus Aminicenantes bacterium]|nr:MAG: SPASM domain-containing protein [Candidatus Aminicenantes bacterium]
MKEIRTAVGRKTPLIEAQALLMKQNEQNIREFKEVLLKTGVDAIRMKTLNVFMSGESPGNEDRDFLPQNPALLRYETHEPQPASQTDKLLLCRWPWDRLIVLADGTITPCCHDFNGNFPLGRVIPNTAREMWDTPQRRQFMVRRILEPRTIPMCRRCSSAVPSHSLRKEVNIDKNRE